MNQQTNLKKEKEINADTLQTMQEGFIDSCMTDTYSSAQKNPSNSV